MAISRVTVPEKTSSIQEFISFKNDTDISYNNLSFRDKYDNIIYPIKNIIDDYEEELMELTIDVELSESEYIKYRYKPKLLAYDIYGEGELDFIIMKLNTICNMKEFDMKRLKLIKLNDLDNFLTSIFNANKSDLDTYNSLSNAYV